MRTALIGAAIAAALFGIAACGANPTHNDADIAFSQQMIPHHQQAVEMAELVPDRTGNPALVALAARVKAAQQPEIDRMTGWLQAWDAPAKSDHAGHDMPGMVDTAALEQVKDAEFDRQWLGSMIQHHRGAVEMAKTEVDKGLDEASKTLARQVVTDQEAEIKTMADLLPQG